MQTVDTWFCDKCGIRIGPDNAYVEWFFDQSFAPRIVHGFDGPYANACCPNLSEETAFRTSLSTIQGPDGLEILCDFVGEERLCISGFVDLFSRLYIPGYEQGRRRALKQAAERRDKTGRKRRRNNTLSPEA